MTLDEHVSRLAKHCIDSSNEDLIKQTILEHKYMMDETSLMSYCVNNDTDGKKLMVMFADGDGNTIWEWMHKVARENGCKLIQCLTNRHRALERKWGFKPIATYMELEVK